MNNILFDISSLGMKYKVIAQPIINSNTGMIHSISLLLKGDGIINSDVYFASVNKCGFITLVIEQMKKIDALFSRSDVIPVINIKINNDMINDLYFEFMLNELFGKVKFIFEMPQLNPPLAANKFEVMSVFDMIHGYGCELWLDYYDGGLGEAETIDLLPWDGVKIDKKLLCNDEFSKIKSIVDYCHAKRIRVVIDGVESEDQYRLALKAGADNLQGFYWPVIRINDLSKLI